MHAFNAQWLDSEWIEKGDGITQNEYHKKQQVLYFQPSLFRIRMQKERANEQNMIEFQ